jgi:hypothetical protein
VEDTLGAAIPVDIWGDRSYQIPSIDAQGQRWMATVGQATAWWIDGGAFQRHLTTLGAQGATIYRSSDMLKRAAR